MKQSEKITELLATLVEVQNELETMPKNRQGYGYRYTDLDMITQSIKPILHKYGIGYVQCIGGDSVGAMTITTRIFNKAGQYIEDTAYLPTVKSAKNNEAQTLGMAIIYMRRYTLCAMLGITSDEDTDADFTPQKNIFTLAGGESTPAEKETIKKLLSEKDNSGVPYFSQNDIKYYSELRKAKTAKQIIEMITYNLNKLKERRK